MAHTSIWSDAPLVIGDQAGEGYDNINTTHTDVSDRMQLEHLWNGGAGGQTTDGIHKPGQAAVVENQSTAATIIAGAGVFGTAYTGSIAMASDTAVLYVKKGTENSATGTWTPSTAGFGVRTSTDSLSRTLIKDYVYLAGSDGFINAFASVDHGYQIKLYSHTNPTPTLQLAQAGGEDGSDWGSICVPIINGNYFKITYGGSTIFIYWLPIGTGTLVRQ